MKKIVVLIACGVIFASLTGCSPGSSEEDLVKDTTYKATLDYKNNVITKPLSEYQVNEKQVAAYNTAHSIIFNQCLQERGYSYPRYAPYKELEGSREYGMWNPEYTEKYGFGITDSLVSKQKNEDEKLNKIPEEFMQECYDKNKNTLDEINVEENSDSVARRLYVQSANAAKNDPEWKSAREKWWQCLADKGLNPIKQDNSWGTEEDEALAIEKDQGNPAIQEENFRLATIEAKCSKDTDMAQKLADLEAAYQGPLVKENQAALNAEKEELNKRVQKAEDFIARNQ